MSKIVLVVRGYSGLTQLILDAFSGGFGVAGEDAVKGVVDEFADEGVREGAVEVEGVPVAFVHVVSGEDGGVFVTENEGAIGVAFEVHADGDVFGGEGGEHFVGDLVDEDFGAEGDFLGGFGMGEEVFADLFDVVHGVEWLIHSRVRFSKNS
jgi:hypothetical protein